MKRLEAKYDKIGAGYNFTRKPDPYLKDRLLFHLQPEINKTYLDIGCGTGNYTNQFQKKGFSFIGIDPSATMLEKARNLNKNIVWKIGTAEKTNLNSNSIDGILASLTIHHWSSLESAFQELNRILKENSSIIIFTSTPKQMKGYWLNHYFPKMLEDSIKQMPSFVSVEKYMEKAGFKISSTEKYNIAKDLEDQFLYCGKDNPMLYFDENIRNGISSFSDLSNADEVENGLFNLRRDIDSGKIKEIQKSYQNNLGDYLFIKAEK